MDPKLLDVRLRVGDLVLMKGTSRLGAIIRWAQRTKKEAPSWANHVGVITVGGPLALATLTESLWHTVKHPLYKNHIGDELTVFRYRGMTEEQAHVIRTTMDRFVGADYGWWKLPIHLIDNRLFGGRVVMRKLFFLDNKPVCSFSTGRAFAAAGIRFNSDPNALQPDDIDDYCLMHPDDWTPVVLREKLSWI